VPRSRWEGAISALLIARRHLVQIRGNPGQLLDATLMPMIFAIVFTYVFGGAIDGSQRAYLQYLLPGIMGVTITIVARTTGISVNVDFGNRFVYRLRSLPIARSAGLAGRVIADSARMLLSQVVLLAFGCLVGFRITTGAPQVVAAIVLMVGFGIALSWASAVAGVFARSVQTAETVTTLVMVPLQFGSSLFVPPGTMPGWLQGFVRANPMTIVLDACRALLTGGQAGRPLLGAVIWIAGLIAICAPLAVMGYHRRR
jgi:oleandomycin transport system permease protein